MKLFKSIIIAIASIFSLNSCVKNDDNTPQFDLEARWEEEKTIIKNHVQEHYPNAIEDELKRGFWYEILEEGDPDSYTYKANETTNQFVYPTATVRYKGQLLDGTVFDQNQTESGWETIVRYNPYGSGIIAAWQVAFFSQKVNGKDMESYNIDPLLTGLTEKGLQVGSKIRFVAPSLFAYSNRQVGSIPANSPLIFEIEVLKLEDK